MKNNMIRYKCANCGHVFDFDSLYVDCPKCGSNACDKVEVSYEQ